MIINISRAKQFQACRRKAYNWDILGLTEPKTPEALFFGSAMHKGFANFYVSRDVTSCVQAVETEFREKLTAMELLPEEVPVYEKLIEQSKHALKTYAENYRDLDFQVLQPEVEFCVPLPNTRHHCWFFHKILHPETLMEDCPYQECRQPIWFKGRTDAVIQMNRMIWLLEHKTSSITGTNFFKHWLINFQPTGYIYGIKASTGIRPHGFILNIIKKPRKNQLDQFAFGFEREPIPKSDDDLQEFEDNIIQIAQDYEHAVVHDRMYQNPEACMNYNRMCQYFDQCRRHHKVVPGEFATREPDYVDQEYQVLIDRQKEEHAIK